MRVFGYFMLLAGLALGAWGLLFNISVETDGNVIDRISNLSLVSAREVILAAAVAAFSCGSAFIAAAEAADIVLAGIARSILKAAPTQASRDGDQP